MQTELFGLIVSILVISECTQAALDARRIFLAGVMSFAGFVLMAVALSVLAKITGA